jgi:cyclopropane fatty-acyl-phospholipid synthase-like methyltransferase
LNPAQASFNNYAQDYDAHFTNSFIGRAQRNIVHEYLATVLHQEMTVLEINCGTGEDALFLSPKCKSLRCSDVSENMIAVAKQKTKDLDNCQVEVRSIQRINTDITYDLIFSNFGGLNCLSPEELKSFSKDCRSLTNPAGELVFVIMGRQCRWERFYFRRKGDTEKASRRESLSGLKTEINGSEFFTYYYSPSEIIALFKGDFAAVKVKPVGIFIPPSYMEPFMRSRPVLFSGLKFLDRVFRGFSLLSDKADHYIIHFRRK